MIDFPILYTFRRCPYAMRARMALVAAEISFLPREILLKNKPASLIKFSSKGTVPVLVLPNGEVIEESLDIMLWALEHSAAVRCFFLSEDKRSFALGQIKVNDQEFKKNLDICKYSVRFSQDEYAEAKKKSLLILNLWNKILQKQMFLQGDSFGFLDMALLPFIRQFAGIKPDIFSELEAPELKVWLKKSLENKIFIKSMEKYSLWID